MGSTLLSIGRFICGLIDSVVYVVISKMYDVFYDVANIFLYSEDIFEVIGQRIGLVLGIFMLFRLAISLVSYLISPDKLNDNSKGGGKMITNIILSLVLLVTVNIIFEQAYKVQNQIVQSRFIEKIFFGSKASAPNLDTAYVLYSSFITPDLNGCEDLFDPYMEMSDDCANSLSAIKNNDVTNLIKNDILKNYKLNKLLSNYDALNYKNAGVYVFDYLPILSTVAGVAVVLVLISFSMDLATRAVKLLFLQIIAPIPIIANIDPGKGSEVFKKWYKECFSTYLSLFIRIIAINFAVFMITLIKTEFHNIFRGKSALITALLVIGCLMFAKQVPKLIEDLLGIKMDGMALKPLKKFQEQALFGKQIGAVAGGVAGGLTAGSLATGAGILTGQGIHRNTFSTAFKSGMKGEKFTNNLKSSYTTARTRHTQLQEMHADGVKRKDIIKENIRGTFGIESNSTKVQRLANQAKSIQSSYDAIKGQMTSCDSNDANVVTHNGVTYNRSAKTISKELDELKKTSVDKQSFRRQAIAAASAAAGFGGMTPAQKESLIQAQMDSMYDAAVTAQKQKIADTEKELEGRINAAVAGIKNGTFGTGVASADKVILEQTTAINRLKEKSNELGLSLDSEYEIITAADDDVVNIMKQGKGVSAQVASGKLQDMADVGKYTNQKK